MLLTPHIVRTHTLTVKDFAPLFVGTQGNLGMAGPPPLIQPQGQAAAAPAAGAPRLPTATPGAPAAATGQKPPAAATGIVETPPPGAPAQAAPPVTPPPWPRSRRRP